jgi:hypothetical protein
MTPAEIEPATPSKRSAADPRLTPLGHWDQLQISYDLGILERGTGGRE